MLFWEKFVNFSKTCKFLLKKLDNDRLKLYNVIRVKVRENLRKFTKIYAKSQGIRTNSVNFKAKRRYKGEI